MLSKQNSTTTFCGQSSGGRKLPAVRKSLYSPGQEKIASAIREMRTDAKLTQRGLAAKLKRPLNVISRIESAQRRVDFLEWIALCKACGADPVKAGAKMLKTLLNG